MREEFAIVGVVFTVIVAAVVIACVLQFGGAS